MWEISLAMLVLVWSLVSLARFKERGRQRGVRSRNVVPLRRTAGVGPSARRGTRRARVPLVAISFALAAASFAYAMPDVLEMAPHGRTLRARTRLREAQQRRREVAIPEVGGSPRGGAPMPVASEPGRAAGGGNGEEGKDVGPSSARGQLTLAAPPAEATAATAPAETAEEPVEPTPLPSVTPTVEPTPTPTVEPTPTATPTS
ncbi:MAG: hypothetical protein ABR529_14615 [Actinomycetota bacterium]